MPLVFKLVGYNNLNKHYEIKDPFNGPVNLKILHELFKAWKVSEDEIHNIKFITDSELIKDSNKCFIVNDTEDRIIFLFTPISDLREKLYNIFKDVGSLIEQKPQQQFLESNQHAHKYTNQYASANVTIVKQTTPDPEICQPLTQIAKPDLIPILTPEIITNINIKTVSLFADPDFKSLINIYIRRPELFSTLAKYVQHGNVIEESLESIKTQEMLTETELEHYVQLCEQIKKIGINAPDNVIIAKLLKYSGHLNLTVRSLLCDSA